MLGRVLPSTRLKKETRQYPGGPDGHPFRVWPTQECQDRGDAGPVHAHEAHDVLIAGAPSFGCLGVDNPSAPAECRTFGGVGIAQVRRF